MADKFSCFVDKLVFIGCFCNDEKKKNEASARQVERLDENVLYLENRFLEAITFRMPAAVERRKLSSLERFSRER